MSDAKAGKNADVEVEEKKIENHPVEKEDAKPEVAASAANPRWQQGEPVEVDVDGDWRLGLYKAYFPQYNYHTVFFADGTSWTGGDKEIRTPGSGE